MIYCPKCGISTDQHVGVGNSASSCSSCGVVWSEFLKSMADNSRWPDIVKRDKHDIICPKCGYERFTSDEAKSRTTCPDCRVSYTDSLFGKSEAQPQSMGQPTPLLPDMDSHVDNSQTKSYPPAMSNNAKANEKSAPIWKRHIWKIAVAGIAVSLVLVYVIGKPFYINLQVEKRRQEFIVKAQNAVKESLIDANSAEFKIESVTTNTLRAPVVDAVVCGSVNAKNRLGGYVGFRKFLWESASGEAMVAQADNFSIYAWNAHCAK